MRWHWPNPVAESAYIPPLSYHQRTCGAKEESSLRLWDRSKSFLAPRPQLFCKNIAKLKLNPNPLNFFYGLDSEPIYLARGTQRVNWMIARGRINTNCSLNLTMDSYVKYNTRAIAWAVAPRCVVAQGALVLENTCEPLKYCLVPEHCLTIFPVHY